MKNFKKTFDRERGNDSRKRDFNRGGSGKRQFGGRDRGRPQMHEAICSDCGKKCEVPFKPTSDKPIYCNECFSKHKGSSVSNSSERRSYERPRFQERRMFDAICDKCGKRFELPFNPTGDKPVYCNECFGRSGGSPGKNNNQSVNQNKEQFEMLNAKLDKIIKVLIPVAPIKEKKERAAVKKTKEAIKKKKTAVKKTGAALKKKQAPVKKKKSKK